MPCMNTACDNGPLYEKKDISSNCTMTVLYRDVTKDKSWFLLDLFAQLMKLIGVMRRMHAQTSLFQAFDGRSGHFFLGPLSPQKYSYERIAEEEY